MADWSSYALSDLLLFSPRVYERMFVLLNQDLWPFQLLFFAAGLAIVLLLWRWHPLAVPLGCAALGVGWCLVAVLFFQGRYQEINWLGGYLAPFAFVQSAALMALAVLSYRRTGKHLTKSTFEIQTANVPLVLGFLAYPLVTLGFGGTLESAQVAFGMPDPTAVATLGLAVLLIGRMSWLVMIVPLAWCMFTGLTLWTLGRDDFFIAPLGAAFSLLAKVSVKRA